MHQYLRAFLFTTLGLFNILPMGWACSCTPLPFCQRIQQPEPMAAVMAVVIRHHRYHPDNLAVYLKVLRTYRDDVGLTDTIKLYGRYVEASCDVNVLLEFPLRDTFIVAFPPNSRPIFNPAAPENHYENWLDLCTTTTLKIKRGRVSGFISGSLFDPTSPFTGEYPMPLFESRLADCSFSPQDVIDDCCQDEDILVHPNPVTRDFFNVSSKYRQYSVDRLRLFTLTGQMAWTYHYSPSNQLAPMLTVPNGVYVLEIRLNNKLFYRKLVVAR